jgi:Glycosyl transferase family 2
MSDVPADVRVLAERRAAAREARDFAEADELRRRIAEAGWNVVDEPDGSRLERSEARVAPRRRPADVASVLDAPETADVTLSWVVEGWPEDLDRALASFRPRSGDRRVQVVIADLTGEAPGRWGTGTEVVALEAGTGWAAARNAALRCARGATIVCMDASVEAVGDALTPLESALTDPSVGVCGPFGIVTEDLRSFHRVRAPADCDAVEAYLMAFRRDTLRRVGGFDERFTWYRSADIEWCFRVLDAGLRVAAVPVPVMVHEHRAWEALEPAEREERSRRNYARFLERWRDRWDLTVRGRPPDGDR